MPPMVKLLIEMPPSGGEDGFCWFCSKLKREVRYLVQREPDAAEKYTPPVDATVVLTPAICDECISILPEVRQRG